MASTGLSRRRVGAGSSTSEDDLRPHSPPGNGTTTSAGLTAHAGSAFEGGSKIAFDPRDLENESEYQRLGGKMPRLTLMEEVLLLGLKDKQVRSLPIEDCGGTKVDGSKRDLSLNRVIYRFGTTIYHMRCGAAF